MGITVSIVEDDRETRETLVELLGGATGLQCINQYPTGEAALRGIPLEKPDVVLVDINLPGMSGIECVSKLKLQLPALQVLMLTTYEESDLIFTLKTISFMRDQNLLTTITIIILQHLILSPIKNCLYPNFSNPQRL